MKKEQAKMKLALIFLTAAAAVLRLPAAVPLSWTVETTRAQPATFEAYQGETIDFEAALQAHGKPLEAPLNYSFFWQTNGMGSTYWEAPVLSASSPTGAGTNVLFATWLPAYDVGAKVYNCFIGSPSNIYHAAFQLRLRPSPGALPNALPLPTPVIDFARVRVLNPPWSGGGGGVDTNAVIDIIHATVDGAARPLPKYLHALDFDDSYPDAADEYYRSRGNGKTDGGCSSVRSGGFLSRNFDFPFDERAEFIVRMSAGTVPSASSPTGDDTHRFASVGVAQVGTNLTEAIVTSGKPSRWYKALPGATVDGINENGVVCEINVVDTEPPRRLGGDIHPLAAVRWALDNGTSAQMVATNLAARIMWPSGWRQNFHWMIADAEQTWIVENGVASNVTDVAAKRVMTNFKILTDDYAGMGAERYQLLRDGENITNAWFTKAYSWNTQPPWMSEFYNDEALYRTACNFWNNGWTKEQHRGDTYMGQTWWQSVHTSIYDISNRVLRVAVQETDDWYTFQVPSSGGTDETKVRAIASEVVAPVASSVSSLQSSKLDKTDGIGSISWDNNGSLNANARTVSCGGGFTTFYDFEIVDGSGGPAIHALSLKADRADSGDDDEIATLDADGNPTRSGIAKDDVITTDGGTVDGDFEVTGNAEIANLIVRDTVESLTINSLTISNTDPVDLTTEDGVLADLNNGKYAHLSNISATDPTFSNAVATVAKTVQPTTVRAYDSVRRCWWVLEIVNGVPTWTVED